MGGARPPEGGEEQLQRLLDLLVGIEPNAPGFIPTGVGSSTYTNPTGKGLANSPRRALLRIPPRKRARRKWSSASERVPFMPNSRRSLKSLQS